MACSTSSACAERYASTWSSVTPRSRRTPSYSSLPTHPPPRSRTTAFTTPAPYSVFFLADLFPGSAIRSGPDLGAASGATATAGPIVVLLLHLHGLAARLARMRTQLAAQIHLLRDGEDVVGEDVEGEARGKREHQEGKEPAHRVTHRLLAGVRHGRGSEDLGEDHRDAHRDRQDVVLVLRGQVLDAASDEMRVVQVHRDLQGLVEREPDGHLDQHREAGAHRVHPVLLEELHLLEVLALRVTGVLLLQLFQLGLDPL